MYLKLLSNETLTEKIRDLSKRDLTLTAEIVSHIHEFMVRRLYFKHGCTSIFGYLTDCLGYPRATAQNRIDAARLLEAVPEIKEELARGKLNLGQITLISMGIRQAEKENPGLKVSVDQKRQLVAKVVNRGPGEATTQGETRGSYGVGRSEHASAQIVAQELDIKINPAERVRVHQDGSVTVEVHLSKEEFENLNRDLNTHKNHNAKLGETVAEAAKFILEKKDPRKLKSKIELRKTDFLSVAGSGSNLKFSSSSNLKTGSPKTSMVTPKPAALNRKRSQRSYLSVYIFLGSSSARSIMSVDQLVDGLAVPRAINIKCSARRHERPHWSQLASWDLRLTLSR